MTFSVPQSLAVTCRQSDTWLAWLAELPSLVGELKERWGLETGPPFDGPGVSCAWVATATRRDGSSAVLKVGMPHMEAEHEIEGLRFWAGDPTVLLLDAEEPLNAMLLERCIPGTTLGSLAEEEQDPIIAGLLRRMWRVPSESHGFRPLSEMLEYWIYSTSGEVWAQPSLVEEGLQLFRELARTTREHVLLATDLHAANVLASEREPWLVIDPKPFVGDPCYDAAQHLLNCPKRMQSNPEGTISRFSDLLGVDEERVRLWTFARAAGEGRHEPGGAKMGLARALARAI